MLIRDFYFEDARRREAKNHKWCIFLCPTQELTFQQARSAQIFTGVRCGECYAPGWPERPRGSFNPRWLPQRFFFIVVGIQSLFPLSSGWV